METYFHGIWRMDWGLGNPNKTAALIAILMVAVWWLASIRRFGFWTALTLFTGLGVCLIRTFSRGGLVALAIGLLPLLWKSARPWPRRKIVAVMISIWIMIGAAVLWEAHERLGQGVAQEDKSITNRLELWMVVPRMMVDAPSGWGLGNAGKTYSQWYQPVERGEDYRTLVNSHLTWLVEFGWLFRLFYIGGWLAAFVLVWPRMSRPWTVIPFGIWLCFGTAAWFSSVAESIWIWIVPALSGMAALLYRLKDHAWPRLRTWVTVGVGAVIILAVLFAAGTTTRVISISGSSTGVRLGAGKSFVNVLVNTKVMGQQYGKAIRQTLDRGANRWWEVSETVNGLSAMEGIVFVCGGNVDSKEWPALKGRIGKSARTIILNPHFLPEQVGLTDGDAPKVTVLFGEFSQSPALSAWDSFAPQRIAGAGDFLPDWATRVLESKP
jgi:hypothetical protein